MRHQRGFTLIELMVVLLLVGLAIGMVDLNLGGNEERKARQYIDQSYRLLRYADESAALQSDMVGLQIEAAINGDRELRWYRLRGGAWVVADAPFVEDVMPENLQFELLIDEQPVDLAKEAETPQVVFSGSGEISNFEMRFALNDQPIGLITVDVTGDLVQADTYEP
ncbi:GspH/FimT family pseudopilin [Simiduia sp. 21SJ11W-1]|uniref:GspH/FimT family pseudopilin n=1 Tax=Simiduia sp. 21SJ11W-1 TaxID=2909669 RepID=UPI00209EF51B|nr:GspH/FimT family pseudopilin [Simiduia sp. 21SJ11W-1]UTA47882.1 GspH/FimT family pseudopilin [Simiduia sp. 21SJ11W-1]